MMIEAMARAERELIDAIINAYHTTRLRDTPVADHILSKPRVHRLLFNLRDAYIRCLADNLPDDAVEAGARAAYEANPTLASVKDLVPIIGPSITAALQHMKDADHG